MSEPLPTVVGRFVDDVIPSNAEDYALKALHEAEELVAAPTPEEAADVLICLMGWAHRSGHGWDDVLTAAEQKMQVNFARSWRQKPDGTWQHVGHAPEPRAELGHTRLVCADCGTDWPCAVEGERRTKNDRSGSGADFSADCPEHLGGP